jgi:hypothetical protein
MQHDLSTTDIDPTLGHLNRVEVGSAVCVSMVNTAVTFRVVVSKASECSRIHPTHDTKTKQLGKSLHLREVQTLNNKIKINAERP